MGRYRAMLGALLLLVVGFAGTAWAVRTTHSPTPENLQSADRPRELEAADTPPQLESRVPATEGNSRVSAPWPESVDRQSALEVAIGVPGSTQGAFHAYVQRASQLVSVCMSEGGFAYRDEDVVTDPHANMRLNERVEIDNQSVSGGCRAWSQTLAFPGNYFGQAYQDIDQEALAHPAYNGVREAYDGCLISAGFPGRPDTTGLSDNETQQLLDRFTAAAMDCDSAAGLKNVNRALEIFIGDTFVIRYPSEVKQYVDRLVARGVLAD